MTHFRYSAVTKTGNKIEGEIEAGSRTKVFDQLTELGHLPVSVHEISDRVGASAEILSWLERPPSKAQITLFTRELSMLLKSGLTLDRALAILAEDKQESRLAKLISKVRTQLNEGKNFAEALLAQGSVFPPVYCNMVRVAEASGTLESVLEQIADMREREQKLRSKVLSAALYPSFLVVAALAMVFLLLTFVVPRFKDMIVSSGAPIPESAEFVLAVSDWLGANGHLLLVGLLASVLTLLLLSGSPMFRGALDAILVRLPIAGHFVRMNLTIRFSRTLATLLEGGVELPAALELCQRVVAVKPAGDALAEAQKALRKGQSFVDPIAKSKLFFPVVINMLRVGEETGNLARSAHYLAQMFEDKLDLAIQRLMTVLEPLIIILVSLFVASIIMAILGAVISVNDLVI